MVTLLLSVGHIHKYLTLGRDDWISIQVALLKESLLSRFVLLFGYVGGFNFLSRSLGSLLKVTLLFSLLY